MEKKLEGLRAVLRIGFRKSRKWRRTVKKKERGIEIEVAFVRMLKKKKGRVRKTEIEGRVVARERGEYISSLSRDRVPRFREKSTVVASSLHYSRCMTSRGCSNPSYR